MKGGSGKRAKGRVRQITKAQWEKADISAPRMSDVNLTPSKFLPWVNFYQDGRSEEHTKYYTGSKKYCNTRDDLPSLFE